MLAVSRAMKFSLTVVVSPLALMLLPGLKKWRASGLAKYCSPAWIGTVRKMALSWVSPAPSLMP
jgi:hypothetical protein